MISAASQSRSRNPQLTALRNFWKLLFGHESAIQEAPHDDLAPLVNDELGDNQQRQRHQESSLCFEIVQKRDPDRRADRKTREARRAPTVAAT